MKNKSENNQQVILSMGKGDEILFKKRLQKISLALIIIIIRVIASSKDRRPKF